MHGLVLPSLLRTQQEVPGSLGSDRYGVFSFLAGGAGTGQLLAFPGGSLRIGVAVGKALVAGAAERNSKATLTNPPRELGGFPRSAVLVDLEQRTVSTIAGLAGNTEHDFLEPKAFARGPLLL